MLHSSPDRRLRTITTSQRGISGNNASEVQTFIALGGITDITQIGALNTLYTDLNTAGLWNKIQVLYPFVGGTATAHALNLKNAAQYPLTFYGSAIHNTNGTTAVASTGSYFATTFDMATMSANDFSFGAYLRSPLNGAAGTTMYPFVTATGSTYLGFRGDAYTLNQAKWAGTGGFGTNASNAFITGASTARFIAASVDSPTTTFSFLNQFTITPSVGTKGSNLTGTISASLCTATTTFPWTYSMWYVATAMTETEIATLNAIFQKFNDTLDTAFGSTRGTDYYINPDFHVYTNRFISTSGASTLSSTEKNALNALIVSLVNSPNGLWSKLQVAYPIASSTNLSTALRELKTTATLPSGSSASATITGTGSTSATGLTMTSTSSYLSVPVISNTASQSIGMYVTEDLAMSGLDICCAIATRWDVSLKNASNNTTMQIFAGTTATVANPNAKGFYIIDCPGTATSTYTLYKNDVSFLTCTSGTASSAGVYFLGVRAGLSSLRDVGFLFYTGTTRLNAAERTELYNIVLAYQQALGRA